MAILLRFVTRKKSGGAAYRDQRVEGDRARFGRSAESEAYLADPRVSLSQAMVEVRGNAAFVSGAAGNDVIVNGSVTQSTRINLGDVVAIGPYDVTVVEPPADKATGVALALAIELVRPLGNDLELLVKRSRLSLEQTWLSRRWASWVLTVLVVLLFLGWPVAAFFNPHRTADTDATKGAGWRPDIVWNSGEISNAHKPIAQQCNRCHEQAFVMVRDQACVACHESIQRHADPKFVFSELNDPLCEHCHKEHNGPREITRLEQGFCADCHGKFGSRAPSSPLLSVGDFAKDHPEFRPSVMVDPVAARVERVSLAASPRPRERSGLTFPHDKHLKLAGIKRPDGPFEVLDCKSCHVMAPGGFLMVPVTEELNCQRCHVLAFDKRAEGRRLPHGNAELAARTMREYYADVALHGGYEDPAAPEVVRRKPGTPITKSQEREALEWADQQSRETTRFIFTRKSVCDVCHQVQREGDGAAERFDVVKPKVAERWLPKGLFRHSAHATETCQRCHGLDVTDPAKWQARLKDAVPPFLDAMLALPAADATFAAARAQAEVFKQAAWTPALAGPVVTLARSVAATKTPPGDTGRRAQVMAEAVVGATWSDDAGDILLPGIDSCRQCHVGDNVISWRQPDNRMPSTCVTCHYFHTTTQGPMYPVPASAAGPHGPGQYRTGGVALDGSLKTLTTGIRTPPRRP